MKKKELQNILSSHDQSYQSLQQSLNIYTKNNNGQPHNGPKLAKIPRGGQDSHHASGNQGNDGLAHLKAGKQDSAVRAQHSPGNLNILSPLNALTNSNALNPNLYGSSKNVIANKNHLRGGSVDVLTGSENIRGKMQQIIGTKGVRDHSVRISKINGGSDELAHNSVIEYDKGKHDLDLSVNGVPKHT